MNKRGQADAEQLFLVMEIVLGMIVAGIFIYGAVNFDSLANINQEYAQQDISLLAESLLASPGTVEYDYNLRSIFSVSIDATEVDVTRTGEFLDAFNYYNVTFKKNQGATSLKVGKDA
jgi:hypothetical protein